MQEPPRYWESASSPTPAVQVWGWSDTSPDDARSVAAQRLSRMRELILSGKRPAERYYDRAPLREPVLHRLVVEGELVGLVTRNRYGAHVLATERVVVADVDLSPQHRGLFRKTKEPDPGPAIERIRRFANTNPGWGVRTYRTAAGLRVLITGSGLTPSSPATTSVLTSLQTDPVYLRLCGAYDCFRARLTPKPWRLTRSFPRYPGWPARDERALAAWIDRYERERQEFAGCHLLAVQGPPPDAVSGAVLELHDLATRADSQAPLA
ncbi:hypothetical protein G9U51_00755 [Calidifontibacter sp. DB0510]|uniref:Uncharacterized protein n=1 Tax=Metallococcus carri TaxID=1656884 RepID=A0A967AWM3_9MICO|nr:hypothetical protein [Metallococcus carri]NHN54314.1 hypothetical protein [Metallococcus carri]NOP36846.1 hypothetical protein [Calidifontibacter sp. DB2511S]